MATHLSTSRIKTIMKSTAEVETVSKESCQLMTKATELLIQSLAREAYKDSNKAGVLDYKNIANVVQRSERYEFLREIIPKKITIREYKNLMKEKDGSMVVRSLKSDVSSSSNSSDSESDSASLNNSD